ncbi:MAG: efflux transporter outer membrane subunit [Opitutales bacterium]
MKLLTHYILLPSLGLTLLALTACKVGPNYQTPQLETATVWAGPEDALTTEAASELRWWTSFEDPLLEDYITTAMRENRNLLAAESRVRRAAALRRESFSGLFPVLNSEARHRREGTSGTNANVFSGGARRTQYDLGLAASWELDLFGGVRRAEEAASARVESELERQRALRLATLAEVARNYYQVRGAQKRIAITEDNIRLQSKTFDLIRNRFESGEASEFDLSRARGQLLTTEARLPNLHADLRAGIYRLSILLGQAPGGLLDEMTTAKALPAPPDRIPLGQSSELLLRRPDLRAAERELAAATADIGAATADLFPRFTLLAGAGRSSASSADLTSPLSNRYNATQLIEWPIFQGFALRARIEAQEAEAQEALALYEQAVLQALADTESALVRYLNERETNTILEDALESRQRAVTLARALFESGEEDFLAVLDAERELVTAEDEQALAQTRAVLELVTLYAALGGGWEAFE